MKRFFSLTGTALLILVLAAGMAGATGEAEGGAAEGPTVIKWFGTRGVPGPDAPIPPMLEELVSQKVGFDVQFEIYGAVDNHMEIIQLNLAANDLPDLFHVFSVNTDFLRQASAKFELAEMEEHMPESTKWLRGLMGQLGLDEEATWAKYQDATDGRMWGTPRIWDTGWIPSGQMWRKDILDDLGYEVPTTIAETEEVFAAYKAAFPDKYAMGASGKSPTWQAFDQVFNAYGIVAGGQGVRDGMIKQYFTFPEYKEALVTLRDWYAKGYIDPEFITHTNGDKFQVFSQGNYLTTEWAGRGNWTADENARNIGPLFHNVPGAVVVPATHIARDAGQQADPAGLEPVPDPAHRVRQAPGRQPRAHPQDHAGGRRHLPGPGGQAAVRFRDRGRALHDSGRRAGAAVGAGGQRPERRRPDRAVRVRLLLAGHVQHVRLGFQRPPSPH